MTYCICIGYIGIGKEGNMTYKKTIWFSKMVTVLFIGLILLLPLQVNAKEIHNGEYVQNQENVLKLNGYINDYANIVNDETEKKIEKKGEELQRTDGTQIVFVTVDSLEGKDIREVAFDTFNFYHLGDEDKNNGVLFITETKGNHDYYMEVGTGLEGSLTDIKSSHLQKEYMVPYFRNGEFDKGIWELYKNTADYIVNPDDYKETLDTYNSTHSYNPSSIVWLTFISAFGGLAIFINLKRRNSYSMVVYGHKKIGGIRRRQYGYENLTPNILSVEKNGKVFAKKVGIGKINIIDYQKNMTYPTVIRVYSQMEWNAMHSSTSSGRRSSSSRTSSSHSFSGGGGHSAGGGSGGRW